MEDKMRVPEVDRFALHVEPHLEALFRMAWRLLRNTPDAQDLVQDTCLIACGRLAEVATTDSPRQLESPRVRPTARSLNMKHTKR
jgi:DNA-directed RNA polymerase specialized sigma24 family protein